MAETESSRESIFATYVPFMNPIEIKKRSGARAMVRCMSTPQRKSLIEYLRRLAVKPKSAPKLPTPSQMARMSSETLQKKLSEWIETAGATGRRHISNAVQARNSQFGFMLMERLVYEPGETLGSTELVKQVYVAPDSVVTLVKKSWSKFELNFEDSSSRIYDEERECSNTSSRELSESTENQLQSNMSYHASTSASGGVEGVWNVSGEATFDLSRARSTNAAEQTKSLQDSTHKASSRMRREHKLTYVEKSEFGSEYSTTEVINNPNTSHAIFVKLFKKFQKYTIRHEQYGVRLCVDVLVRNPGKKLRANLVEKFDPALVPDPVPYEHHEGIPEPPAAFREEIIAVDFPIDDPYSKLVTFVVPDDYVFQFAVAERENGGTVLWGGTSSSVLTQNMIDDLHGTTRVLSHFVTNWGGTTADPPMSDFVRKVNIRVRYRLSSVALARWKTEARRILVEVAEESWERKRKVRDARKLALMESSSVPPRQRLRKEERQELFGAVAKFLVMHEDTPQPVSLEDTIGVPPSAIKELDAMFEWSASGVFLYPYWWDPAAIRDVEDSSGSKILLSDIEHEDFMRQEFLKASWARVMVPVRRGRERFVLQMLYGEEMRRAFEDNDEEAREPFGGFVKACNAIDEAESEEGEFGLQADSSSEIAARGAVVLAKWNEYVPTDEVDPVVGIVCDEHGHPMDLAEPFLQAKQSERLRREKAFGDICSAAAQRSEDLNLAGRFEMSLDPEVGIAVEARESEDG